MWTWGVARADGRGVARRRRACAAVLFSALLSSLAASALYRASLERVSITAACGRVAALGALPRVLMPRGADGGEAAAWLVAAEAADAEQHEAGAATPRGGNWLRSVQESLDEVMGETPPPLPASPVSALWRAQRERDSGHDARAATDAGIRLSLSLVDGEPTETLAARTFSPASLLHSLSPLIDTARIVLDVDVAPPAHLAFARLMDASLLQPTRTSTPRASTSSSTSSSRLIFLAPSWALPATPSLLNELPLTGGATDVLTAYPVEEEEEGGGDSSKTMMMGGRSGVVSSSHALHAWRGYAPPLLLPYGAYLTSAAGATAAAAPHVRGEDMKAAAADETRCVCTPAERGESGALYGSPARTGDGSLGRTAWSLWSELHQWLTAPTFTHACTPENLLRCTCPVAEGIMSSNTHNSTTRHLCVSHRGARALHAVGYVPPSATAPLYFEHTRGGDCGGEKEGGGWVWPRTVSLQGTNETCGVSSLDARGWGSVHVLNNYHAGGGGREGDEDDLLAGVSSQLRRVLGVSATTTSSPLACHTPSKNSGSTVEGCTSPLPLDTSFLMRWVRIHWTRAREGLLQGVCALAAAEGEPGQRLQSLRIPAHVAAQVSVSAQLLSEAQRHLEEIGVVDEGRAGVAASAIDPPLRIALDAVRLARYHADATRADALVYRDGAMSLYNTAATYLPWWGPLFLPVLLSLTTALAAKRK